MLRNCFLIRFRQDLEKTVQKGIQKENSPFPGQVGIKFPVDNSLVDKSVQIGPGGASHLLEVSSPAGQMFVPQDMHVHPVQSRMLADKGQAGGQDDGQPGEKVLVPGVLPNEAQVLGNDLLGLGEDMLKKALLVPEVLKY